EMEEEPFIRQIRLQFASARVCYPHRQIVVVHLEDNNVLQLVAIFFADINLPPGKLIDHLVAAEERDRILGREIKDAAPQLFLRGGGDGDVEPETDCGGDDGEKCERQADPRYAHAIGPERNEFVVSRKPAEDE